jgi:hypothetical protein
MDVKDKNWESGPHQDHLDKRIEEQISRAAEEVDRRKDNLDDKGEGSYQEKNGDDDKQFDGLKSEPKLDQQPSPPETEKE